jgi:hypothetical protein
VKGRLLADRSGKTNMNRDWCPVCKVVTLEKKKRTTGEGKNGYRRGRFTSASPGDEGVSLSGMWLSLSLDRPYTLEHLSLCDIEYSLCKIQFSFVREGFPNLLFTLHGKSKVRSNCSSFADFN